MIRAALRRVTIYHIQISEKIHADMAIPTELHMYKLNEMVYNAYIMIHI